MLVIKKTIQIDCTSVKNKTTQTKEYLIQRIKHYLKFDSKQKKLLLQNNFTKKKKNNFIKISNKYFFKLLSVFYIDNF